jgi:hypothetical protein
MHIMGSRHACKMGTGRRNAPMQECNREGDMAAENSPTHEDFTASLAKPSPPAHWSAALRALWHLEKGDRNAAHKLAQEDESDPQSAWVHAHLHRIEGDEPNAGYWYRRAGQPVGTGSHETERRAITAALIVGVGGG